MLRVEALVQFINGQNDVKSFEYSHLKMSALYWSLATLILLKGDDALNHSPLHREEIVQFLASCRNEDGGFGGDARYDSHLLFTLSALQIYKMLNEPIPNKHSCAEFVLSLWNSKDGSFTGDEFGEVDNRFSYCALMSLHLLDWNFDASFLDKSVSFVERCRNWDGGYGSLPGAESHAGQIFCCQAILTLFNRQLPAEKTIEWLFWRQCFPSGGLNGRPQKLEDVCYSWWVLSALANLNSLAVIDREALFEFILNSQEEEGPIADRPGDMGDIFHSFFGVAGLCLLEALPNNANVQIDPICCLPK